jgi:paraquat-inducible protein B
MPESGPPNAGVPESRALSRKRTRISLVWIIPLVAAAAGVWVAATRILGAGPEITIILQSAEGLEAGKTKIQYNGVEVGTLTTIRLADNHQNVIATAQMAPKTENFLVEDTQFWVVRARISGANVTGLGTLLSGVYIGMDIGKTKTSKREFVALATPPVVTGDVPGRFFSLSTPDLGSLETGTPVFFRRLQVGEVASYALDHDGRSLSVQIFVNAPYDQYVTPNTRFWQASGIDVSLTATGLSVETQSLLSILLGGIAFENSATDPVLPPAEPDTVFSLFGSRTEAFKMPPRSPQRFELIFTDSVRGLAAGAPVEFRGIPIGEVADVRAHIDAKTFEFSAPVTILLDAPRLGVQIQDLEPGADFELVRRQMIDSLVAHGVRAQLRSGSLLTGALYVAFDVFPDAAPAAIDWSQTPPRLPTMPGQLEALENSLASIIKKIDQLPLDAIGKDAQAALVELDRTLASARGTLDAGRGTLDSANRLIAPNSVLAADLANTLQEVSRAARAVRVLADYLERHPEALIRGKTGEAK